MSDQDMSEAEFKDIIKDVASFFGAPRDRQAEILYDIFKPYPYEQMKKACRFLIEHHDSRYFPTPRDIHDALREVAELKAGAPPTYETPEEESAAKCHDCAGIGWSVEDRTKGDYCYHVAVYCHCAKGQRMKAAHTEYLKRRMRD